MNMPVDGDTWKRQQLRKLLDFEQFLEHSATKWTVEFMFHADASVITSSKRW
jgi:hypothetical protein